MFSDTLLPLNIRKTKTVQGTRPEDIEAEDPDEMLKQFDEKFCTLQTTKDFYTPEMLWRYHKQQAASKDLVCRDGMWGVLRTHDGEHREGVPQCIEGAKSGTLVFT